VSRVESMCPTRTMRLVPAEVQIRLIEGPARWTTGASPCDGAPASVRALRRPPESIGFSHLILFDMNPCS
jgi:hypothetical protein